MRHVTAVLLGLLLGVPVTLLGANVLQDLWLWFVVPFRVMTLSIFHAAGLLTVVSLAKLGLQMTEVDKDNEAPVAAVFIRLVIYTLGYLLAWGMGAIWHFLAVNQ